MFSVPISAVSRPAAFDLSGQFALIIDGLCQAVAARAPGNLAAAPLLVLLWSRLRRLARRFATLVERAGSGTLPVRRYRVAGAARAAQTGQARQRWPSGYAWLVRLVPEAASYGSQLQHLLSQPEMAALIAAAPQAERMFGPLRQMLAVPVTPPRAVKHHAPPVVPTPVVERPALGFLPSGVAYRARDPWPGPVWLGRERPARDPPARVARWCDAGVDIR